MAADVSKLSKIVHRTSFLVSLLTFSVIYFVVRTGLLDSAMQRIITVDVEEEMLNQYKLNAHRQIQWLADKASRYDRELNDSSVDSRKMYCRNTRQGKYSIADDRGYVCDRSHLKANGCCEIAKSSEQFTCAGCNQERGCCQFQEHCVSCCLRPDQKAELIKMIKSTTGHRLRQMRPADDQFSLCLVKCRTSSGSVYSENKYKNPSFKFCYKQELPHLSEQS